VPARNRRRKATRYEPKNLCWTSRIHFSGVRFLTGCSSSSSSTPKVAITATSGGGQTAQVGAPFTNPLVATVNSNGSPASGVSVTFTAPARARAAFSRRAEPPRKPILPTPAVWRPRRHSPQIRPPAATPLPPRRREWAGLRRRFYLDQQPRRCRCHPGDERHTAKHGGQHALYKSTGGDGGRQLQQPRAGSRRADYLHGGSQPDGS